MLTKKELMKLGRKNAVSVYNDTVSNRIAVREHPLWVGYYEDEGNLVVVWNCEDGTWPSAQDAPMGGK